MNKNNNLPLYLGLAVGFGVILGSYLNIYNAGNIYQSNSNSTVVNGKLNAVLQYIENEYVDDVDTEKIIDEVIAGMVNKLDPHSTYISKQEQQHQKETMEGNFEGIGVQFVKSKDSVVVVKVLPDGPSKKVGIQEGDRLLKANNFVLCNKNLNNDIIISKLKGPANTKVKVSVYRPSVKKTILFNITRGKIAIKSVPVAFKINKQLGYIKLEQFAMTSYNEINKALSSFKKQGVKDIVLDLRGNPGGFMEIANQIADEFLADGKLIVYTKNKKGHQKNAVATNKGKYENGHIYVLVDENSASASEIIAGAIQDNDRGTIIGRRTFGKGLVQQEMGFEDGSAMRLTVARYYTPVGRSIQKPYESKTDKAAYENDMMDRLSSGELFHKDSMKINKKLKYKTPKGKVVYGGGGIIPDIFVPLNQNSGINYGEYALLNEFVYQYIDQHRTELSKYNQSNFIKNFQITPAIWSALQQYTKNYKFSNPAKATMFLKQIFASNLVGDRVYYQMILTEDPYIKEVIQLNSK